MASSHFPFLENPAAFNAVVEDFLAGDPGIPPHPGPRPPGPRPLGPHDPEPPRARGC
ncbi:hypothetical protein [Streptomyces sp. CB01881]|uniref:hypothetical protein n=1 Tax=Streptomyces sp. CB01881 TaxID=2078691 RepID=UPI001F4FF8A4|nr:hypothetical protein [Streptomyces sp. CB01881]